MQTAPTTSPKTDLSDVTIEGAPGGARKEGASQVGALKALEFRLAAAVGPDRELDLQISVAVNFKGVFEPGKWSWSVFADEIKREGGGVLDPVQFVPQWTRNIGAALTLVPDDLYWMLAKGRLVPEEPLYGIGLYRHDDHREDDPFISAEHENRELCVLLAAIRARISQSGQE